MKILNIYNILYILIIVLTIFFIGLFDFINIKGSEYINKNRNNFKIYAYFKDNYNEKEYINYINYLNKNLFISNIHYIDKSTSLHKAKLNFGNDIINLFDYNIFPPYMEIYLDSSLNSLTKLNKLISFIKKSDIIDEVKFEKKYFIYLYDKLDKCKGIFESIFNYIFLILSFINICLLIIKNKILSHFFNNYRLVKKRFFLYIIFKCFIHYLLLIFISLIFFSLCLYTLIYYIDINILNYVKQYDLYFWIKYFHISIYYIEIYFLCILFLPIIFLIKKYLFLKLK